MTNPANKTVLITGALERRMQAEAIKAGREAD